MKFINKESLGKMMNLIEQRLKEGYIFASLDECGFGSCSLQKYGWAKKGVQATGSFKRLPNTSLLAVINPHQFVAGIFVKGGVDRFIYHDFLKNLFERYEGRGKLLLLVDNLSSHKS